MGAGREKDKTNHLNQVLISILGLVLSIFHYKHLMIWFSNLGCLALHNGDLLSPLPRGKRSQGLKRKKEKKEKATGSDVSAGCAVKPHTSWSEGCEESTPGYSGAKRAGMDTGEKPTDTGAGWAHPIQHGAAVTHRHMHTQSQEEKRKMQVLEETWEKAECSLEH